MNFKHSLIALGALVAGALTTSAPVMAAGDVAVLVVGKSTDADLAARERAVIDQLTRSRSSRGWNHKVLPIYSYHFDKTVERTYCEERLKVKGGDLIVVGVVELESGVPVRFLHRENGVKDAAAVASQAMEQAQKELASHGAVAVKPTVKATVKAIEAKPATKPVESRPAVVAETQPATKPVETKTVVVETKPAVKPAETKPVASKPIEIPAIKPVVVESPIPMVKAPATRPVETKPVAVEIPKPVESKPPLSEGTPVPVADEKWSVQLGMFSTVDKARIFVESARPGCPQIEIRKSWKDGVVVYRVLTGIFASQAEAYARARELKEAGLSAFSVRIDNTIGTVVP